MPESPTGPLRSDFETLASSLLGLRTYIMPGIHEALDKYLPDRRMSDLAFTC